MSETEGLVNRLMEPDWHDPACPFTGYCHCGNDGELPPHDRVRDPLRVEAASALSLLQARVKELEEERASSSVSQNGCAASLATSSTELSGATMHRKDMHDGDLIDCARANTERMHPASNLGELLQDLANRLEGANERELWR